MNDETQKILRQKIERLIDSLADDPSVDKRATRCDALTAIAATCDADAIKFMREQLVSVFSSIVGLYGWVSVNAPQLMQAIGGQKMVDAEMSEMTMQMTRPRNVVSEAGNTRKGIGGAEVDIEL